MLKKLVDEYGFHWRLIAETFNFYRRSNPMEMRTPSHCYVRYDLLWGDHSHVPEGDVSMDGVLGDSPTRTMDLRHANTPVGTSRRPRAPEEFVPTAQPGDEDAKFMRHRFVHRAIKRVMKKREEEAKARGNATEDEPYHVLNSVRSAASYDGSASISRRHHENEVLYAPRAREAQTGRGGEAADGNTKATSD